MATQRPNGLRNFSVHAYDAASAATVDQMRSETAAFSDFRPEGSQNLAELDPETAARRHLDQALASEAAPAFTAPAGAGAVSDFKAVSTETVPLTGTRTVKFRQTLNGVPVYGTLVTVELDSDNSLVGLDSSLGQPDVDPVASVSPADAVAAAGRFPGYKPSLEGIVPQINYWYDPAASQWRLVYILENVPVTRDQDTMSEEDRTSSLEPPRYVDYVVDAHEGAVVSVAPRTPSMTATGQTTTGGEVVGVTVGSAGGAGVEQTATDGFGVERTFLCEQEGEGFALRDPVHNVHTFDFGFKDPTTDGGLPGDGIVNPPDWAPEAVSAHANAVAVSDFLRTVLLRDNIDDKGGVMVSTINCVVESDSPGPKQWVNAFWSPELQQMVYGQVLVNGSLRSLSINVDVVAHEIFHGVTDSTARLEYQFQSGAMNESYSDIFGTIVANRGNDDTRQWDWQLGERLLPGDKPFRDLSDPTKFHQPAHMDDYVDLPNTQAGDWGGVHVNSGIHNKAAFLVLTSVDDAGDLVMTPTESAAVFYLALSQRLSQTSQFSDSRSAVVASARTLFRNAPEDERERKVAAIEAAFSTVGIE
jgi:Zn-dependent metalloprotease